MPKISDLTAATAIDADDLLYVVEDGNSRKATTEAIVKAGSNASGDAPVYGCRAWVNFDGTGTVAIRASGNVSSVTDLGVGSYQVNFLTAMPDGFYSAVTGTTGPINIEHCVAYISNVLPTSVTYNTFNTNNSGARADEPVAMLAIFR